MTRTAAALLAVLALGAAAGRAAADPMPAEPLPSPAFTLGEERNGAEVTVAAATLFAVELESASGGGYLWTSPPLASPSLELLGVETLPAPSERTLGAPARQRFVFRAGAAGTADVALVLSRPWQPDTAPLRRFTLRVLVTAD